MAAAATSEAAPDWSLKPFAALTPAELQAIHRARQAVFVVEQNCAYQDADDYDAVSHHLCGWTAGQGALLAYLRILPPGARYGEASLGRVITTAAGRGRGLGKLLLRQGITVCGQLHPGHPIRISAQHYLERFYQAAGFETVSEPYLEDNIPHIAMRRAGDNTNRTVKSL